jgi:AcrR family transcriptional regulator
VATVKKNLSRQAKAAATRARMLRAAYDLFCEQGFKATTMEAIAQRAGVAVQTLYFAFRTKDALLQQVHDWTVLGDDPTPPPLQAWYLAAVAEADAGRSLELIAHGLVTINARVAPTVPVFQAVAGDPAGGVWVRSQELRRTGMQDLVEMLVKKRSLRRGITKRQAVDLMFILTGPASYREFVIEAGWSPARWSAWVSDALRRDLFGGS